MDVNCRKKQLKDLDMFLSDKTKIFNSVLDKLGWSEESMKSEVKEKVRCPVNSGHWVHEDALSRHTEICRMIKNGYLKEDLDKQPPDSSFFYEKSQNVVSVSIDSTIQVKVLSDSGLINKDNASCLDFPKTVDRWTIQFTPEQKVALYDYIVNASKIDEKPKNVTLEDLMIDFEKKEQQEERPKSHLEILAEQRDYKRRRQSYRAKNVHITKKSYTEIMKEVIENQTNYLVETNKTESSEKNENENAHTCKRRYNSEHDGYHNLGDEPSKPRKYYSDYKEDSRRHHSHHDSSRHHSPKRKKHKKDRSRSRSPRHKHKKSHKRKKSHD